VANGSANGQNCTPKYERRCHRSATTGVRYVQTCNILCVKVS